MTFKRLIVLAVSAAFGGFLGWAMERASPEHRPVGPLMFLVFFFAAIFVHELGHVLGALIVRFQVNSFTVGPLLLRREPAGMRFRRTHVRIGGFVGIVPLGEHELRKRMLIVVAAGPISSFVFALLGFALGHTFGGTDWMSPFGVVSGGLGVLSLIPMRKFCLSDGAQIWDLVRSPEKAERQCAFLALLGAMNSGSRPREWDAALVAKTPATTDGSGRDISANLIAYEWAMDRNEFDLAEKHLEAAAQLQAKCPPVVKAGIALDAAFFYSIVREDAMLAREWLDNCDRRYLHDHYAILMVEAAVLLVEGKSNDALQKVQESSAALPQAQFPGFAIAAKDWLKIISERAQTSHYALADASRQCK